MPKIVTGLNEKHHTILEILGVRYLRFYGLGINYESGAE
jgi:hypothetical protein